MEYIIMFVTHVFKVAEFYLVEGLQILPLEQIIYVPEALFWQTLKIAEIYLTVIH